MCVMGRRWSQCPHTMCWTRRQQHVEGPGVSVEHWWWWTKARVHHIRATGHREQASLEEPGWGQPLAKTALEKRRFFTLKKTLLNHLEAVHWRKPAAPVCKDLDLVDLLTFSKVSPALCNWLFVMHSMHEGLVHPAAHEAQGTPSGSLIGRIFSIPPGKRAPLFSGSCAVAIHEQTHFFAESNISFLDVDSTRTKLNSSYI